MKATYAVLMSFLLSCRSLPLLYGRVHKEKAGAVIHPYALAQGVLHVEGALFYTRVVFNTMIVLVSRNPFDVVPP